MTHGQEFKLYYPPIVENQMEKKGRNELATEGISGFSSRKWVAVLGVRTQGSIKRDECFMMRFGVYGAKDLPYGDTVML